LSLATIVYLSTLADRTEAKVKECPRSIIPPQMEPQSMAAPELNPPLRIFHGEATEDSPGEAGPLRRFRVRIPMGGTVSELDIEVWPDDGTIADGFSLGLATGLCLRLILTHA
jgi:hypothetical protein